MKFLFSLKQFFSPLPMDFGLAAHIRGTIHCLEVVAAMEMTFCHPPLCCRNEVLEGPYKPAVNRPYISLHE